jgi:hypothetical protein
MVLAHRQLLVKGYASGNDSLRFLLLVHPEPASPLFWTPARQRQGFLVVFLLVVDGCSIKVGYIAKKRIIGTLRALQPFCQLFLGAGVTEIVEGGPPLLIPVFILKGRCGMLTSEAGAIPQILIPGIAFEAPDDCSS